jgi:hypothetical protein
METIETRAGAYRVYLGSEAPREGGGHAQDKWYFEPAHYVGFTVFSEPYDSLEDARQAARETGDYEERMQNEIGGGG